MKLPARSEMMQSLVQERKENQREERLLQEEIDRILQERVLTESASKSAEELAELDRQLQKLSDEKEDLVRQRRNLCALARAVGAGD